MSTIICNISKLFSILDSDGNIHTTEFKSSSSTLQAFCGSALKDSNDKETREPFETLKSMLCTWADL